MKKKIAVYICAVCMDNQRRVVSGILEEAKKEGIDVYIFTSHISYIEEDEVKYGAYKIMDLPNPKDFDGIVLVRNTLQDEETAKRITKKILDSGVPAVCIDEEIDGLNYIGVSGYSGITKVMEHLITEHGVKNIKYVAGILGNKEGQARYNAYIDSMLSNGLEVKSGDCFVSDYSIEGGRSAANYFWENGDIPEAIVCANDNMAIGVIEELKEHGINCPKDVLVTGVDGDSLGNVIVPTITTIDRNQELVGKNAVKMILEGQNNDRLIIDTRLILRGSCGCKKTNTNMSTAEKELYVRDKLIMDKAIENVKNMTSDMASLDDEVKFEDVLQKYIQNSDVEKFWFCMCDKDKIFKGIETIEQNIADVEVCDDYSKYMTGYCFSSANGKISEEVFKASDIIPHPQDEGEAANYYIISPIHYRNRCFGYSVSKNSSFALYSQLYYAWINNVGVGLENIRKKKILRSVINLLDAMWAYDTLTNLYNRAGFFAKAKELLQEKKEEYNSIFIVFMDLDGLKKVNDTYGHDAGDRYIKSMADIIKGCLVDDEIVMRYGGDEFVILGFVKEHEDENRCMIRIQSKVDMYNYNKKKDYNLSVSMGGSTHVIDEIQVLDKIIEDADKEMYRVKKSRK